MNSSIWISQANPWLLARQRYLATLTTEEEKKLFTYASLENLFYTTSVAQNDHRENSKSRAFIEKLGPFLEAIEDYGKALDVFSNASSAIMCPLWGSIRVVLHAASEFDKYFNRLVEMLVTIGDYLPGMRVYEKIFKGHPDLLHSLSEVYLDIITFCMDANKVFKEIKQAKATVWSAPQVTIIWRPFDRKFGKVVDNFRRHKANVERGASVSHMIEAAGERTQAQLQRAELNAIQKGARQAQFLQYLSSVDHQYRHHHLRKKRHENTGTWIFASEKFGEWVRRTGSCLLWCYGIPGSGKTIVTTAVVDELFANPAYNSSAIVYFYCDYSNQKTLEASEIFGSFIKQLLSRVGISDEIQLKLTSTYQDGISKPDSEDLLKILLLVLKTFDSVFFVLDGIDECGGNDRVELLMGIQSIIKSGPAVVRFFLASRADVDLKRAFSNNIHLPISTNDVTTDIVSFVNSIVDAKIQSRDLVVRDSSLARDIVDALVKGAQGMFIWVTFQIVDICEEATDNGIRRVLRSLPAGLAETYDRALKKINKREAAMAQKIFKWMACAKRPLSMDEIKEAISIDPLDKYLDQDKITTDSSRIIRACANLVVFDSDEGNVRFAHYSVQEFLLSDPVEGINAVNIQFKLPDAEHEVGEICVTYLSFSNFERQVARQEAKDKSTTTNLSLLGSTFLLRQSYLGWCGKFVFDGWARFRGIRASQPKISINWGEYLKHTRVAPAPNFEQQYRLLNYIIESWAWHTLGFSVTNTGPQIWTAFTALALRQNLPFSFRPWGDGNKIRDFPHMPMILWALDVGHATLLRLLLEPAEGPNLRAYLAQEVEEDGSSLLNVALHRSAQKGYVNVVGLLLENGADHNSRDRAGDRALHHASSNGHDAVVKILLESKADPNAMNDSKDTPLHAAALNGNETIVKLLLQNKPDLDVRNDSGNTALYEAAYGEQKTIVRLLVAYGLDGTAEFLEGSRKGHLAVVKLLLENWVDRRVGNDGLKDNALILAARRGHDELAKLLLDHHANPNAKESHSGDTALHAAASGGHNKVIAILLESKVDQGAENAFRNTPLYMAVFHGHKMTTKLLVERGSKGATELRRACHEGKSTMVRLLVDCGVDGATELHEACQEANDMRVGLLIECGVDGKAELHQACQVGAITTARLLLNYGTDPNATIDGSGSTSLHEAARGGHDEVVGLLLDHEADPNAKMNESGSTALHEAARGGYDAALKLLLDHKADPNAKMDDSGSTALHEAARGGHDIVLKLLLDHKADPNAKMNDSGSTALHEAARGGHDIVLKLLLDHKADPNAKMNKSGSTALHEAARGGHDLTVKLLLGYGADPNAKMNDSGTTVLSEASRGGHITTARLMLEYGVDGTADLLKACKAGNITLAKSFVESGVDGTEGLLKACKAGNITLAKSFVESGVDGTAGLLKACKAGNITLAKSFVESGVDGTAILLKACEVGNITLAKLFVGSGVDGTADLLKACEIRNITLAKSLVKSGVDGTVDLLKACAIGNITLAKSLVKSGVDGTVSLFKACEAGNITIVKFLIESGVDPNSKKEGPTNTPLHLAARYRHDIIVKLLLKSGADHAARDSMGDTPLLETAYKGQDTIAKMLLESGADHGVKNNRGKTSLHYAAMGGYYTLVKLLLESGADWSVEDGARQTPLMEAIQYKCNAVAKLLESWAADHAKNPSEKTPIHAATLYEHEETINLLHEPEIEYSEAESSSQESFYSAVLSEGSSIIRLPAENKVDENTEPLHPSPKDDTVVDLLPKHDPEQNAGRSNPQMEDSSEGHRLDLMAKDKRGGSGGSGKMSWRDWTSWRSSRSRGG